MPEQTESTAPQIIPGAVRTASMLIAAQVVSTAADWGLDISDRVANLIGFAVAIAAYVWLRRKELLGSGWATRVLGLGTKKAPEFKTPTEVSVSE